MLPPAGTVVRVVAILAAAAIGPAAAQDVPYGVGNWPEALGNHRARVRVEQQADAVWAHLPWRRRDAAPDRIEILVLDAATNQRVENVLRVSVRRESGDLLFQPVTVPGEYFVYYLPYKTEGSWYFPTTVYLPPSHTARPAWADACKPLVDRLRAGNTANLPAARVLEFQAINAFHRCDPMEVVASAEEVKTLLTAHSGRRYLVFPEDRRYPIRMTDELPLCWVRRGPSAAFAGDACRGEFYAWQIGLYASAQPLEEVAAELSNLTSAEGKTIPAALLRCFNLGGTDWLGRPLRKVVGVPQGKVQALWLGAAVPRDAAPGTYRGTVTLRARNAPATPVTWTLKVSDKVLADSGDGELWRHARLRWLDSTIGLDDEVFPPYTPVAATGKDVALLGRAVRLAESGLLSSITSSFTRNVDGTDGPAQELLAEPMRLVVEPQHGPPATWQSGGPKIVSQAPGAVSWEAINTAGSLELRCRAKLECDGYVNFRLTLTCRQAARLGDVRLEIPLRREIATYMMGLGRKGGYRPKQWQWKWDAARSNNQLWVGDVNAGLSCKLKHTDDREIMKRVRKVLQRARPGCLIDFHSGNHFHPEYGLNNCANLYIEMFPCIDSLWFGEGFDYNEPPDYWMVEMAGIPYGLFGEMLHGGGNPWRGMVYGMTNRLGWGGDPRGLWKLWDQFGIAQARMIGYWDPACPVKTGRSDVPATVYQREGRSLVALASWAPGPARVSPAIDFSRLGLDPAKAGLYAPPIAGFQGEVAFKPGDSIPVAPGRGWLLVLDEQSRQVPKAADLSAGRKVLLEDSLAADPLAKDWTATLSKRPGTAIRTAGGELRIEGAANVAAYVERAVPAGARLIVCRIDQRTDGGASWGPGMTLIWPNGTVLRVNLRAEGRFGVDDGRRQLLDGVNLPNTWTQLAVRLEDKEIIVQASQEQQAWQELARFPRSEFAGDPVAVRLGKMSPGSKNEDFETLGPAGACAIKEFRVLGKP